MRTVDSALLEDVRGKLRNDPEAQKRHREFQEAMGYGPTPYEPSEELVRSHACRIAVEQEREQLIAKIRAERPEITQLYAQYEAATTNADREPLAAQLEPLIAARISALRIEVGGTVATCGHREADRVKHLYDEMTGYETMKVVLFQHDATFRT